MSSKTNSIQSNGSRYCIVFISSEYNIDNYWILLGYVFLINYMLKMFWKQGISSLTIVVDHQIF